MLFCWWPGLTFFLLAHSLFKNKKLITPLIQLGILHIRNSLRKNTNWPVNNLDKILVFHLAFCRRHTHLIHDCLRNYNYSSLDFPFTCGFIRAPWRKIYLKFLRRTLLDIYMRALHFDLCSRKDRKVSKAAVL